MLARVTERERERVQFSSLMSKLAGMELEVRISHPSAPSFPYTREKSKEKWEGAGRVSVHAGWRREQAEVSFYAGWRRAKA
jgi:hypothetical protein